MTSAEINPTKEVAAQTELPTIGQPLTLSNQIQSSTSTRVTMKILTTAKRMNLETSQALELVDVALCESNFHQDWPHPNIATSTGEVMSTDYGVFQINDHYHGARFDKLGLDYKNSEDDNITAGILLYQQFGSKPWSASRRCLDNTPVGWH